VNSIDWHYQILLKQVEENGKVVAKRRNQKKQLEKQLEKPENIARISVRIK
jgi:hypothetical protein